MNNRIRGKKALDQLMTVVCNGGAFLAVLLLLAFISYVMISGFAVLTPAMLAFDAGGIKDWLLDGQNGYLVPWMDRDAFAGRLDQLLTDKAQARRMGDAGLRLVSERYDFDGYIRDLECLFTEVIGSRRTA